jgi:hypothetical protein
MAFSEPVIRIKIKMDGMEFVAIDQHDDTELLRDRNSSTVFNWVLDRVMDKPALIELLGLSINFNLTEKKK